MAAFGFLRKILASEEIEIFNNGNMKRDFTYIDDVVESVLRILAKFLKPDTISVIMKMQNLVPESLTLVMVVRYH